MISLKVSSDRSLLEFRVPYLEYRIQLTLDTVVAYSISVCNINNK